MLEYQNQYEQIPQSPTPEVKKTELNLGELPRTKEEYKRLADQIVENPHAQKDVQDVAKAQEALMSGVLKGQMGQEFEAIKAEAFKKALQEYQSAFA